MAKTSHLSHKHTNGDDNGHRVEYRVGTATQLSVEEEARIQNHSLHLKQVMGSVHDFLTPAEIKNHPMDTQHRIDGWGSLVMEYGRKIQYEIYRRYRFGDEQPEAHQVTGDPKELRDMERKFLTKKTSAVYPHDLATWQMVDKTMKVFEKHGEFQGIGFSYSDITDSDKRNIAAVAEMKAATADLHNAVSQRSEISHFAAAPLTPSLLKAAQRRQNPPLSRIKTRSEGVDHHRKLRVK